MLLERLFHTRAAVSAVDAPSQFYVLWRYFYGRRELEAGNAIVFAYPLHVELDGPRGLSSGRLALLEKKKGRYRLRDFAERVEDEELAWSPSSGCLSRRRSTCSTASSGAWNTARRWWGTSWIVPS